MTTRKYTKGLDIRSGTVDMTHGAGGRAMAQLIDELFKDAFANDYLAQGNDQAVFSVAAGRMVMTTDSYVVSPIFFPGGNIGSIAVHGTVNDIAMGGATPLYLSCGFILEEGYPLKDLKAVVQAMAAAAQEAGVRIITGDTKVVERGKGDGIYINTAGVGVLPDGVSLSYDRIQPGDAIIVSGTIGDHGIAILSHRENLTFETAITSDSAALNGLVQVMLDSGVDLHAMRDPTRGGVAATLNELAQQVGAGMVLQEEAIPVAEQVRGACELLGIDPLNVANEGKLLAFCPADQAQTLVSAMQTHPLGQRAAVIGHVIEDENRFVQMKTAFGGGRMVDWLAGEQLPRIC